jgi:carbonic anhydrase/SulP family sulfate permease
LCLGIAHTSGAPLFAGLLAGIIGGIIVGSLSQSQTSVSGPAAGLIVIVAGQIEQLGFDGFLLAVVIGGIFQLVLGLLRAGSLSAFFPSSVIKGLLAAIGVILVLKEIPHLLGRDSDPEGDFAFFQFDKENTFSEISIAVLQGIHPGALTIGLLSIALLVLWQKVQFLKNSLLPGPLVVAVVGVLLNLAFREAGRDWYLQGEHLVQLPRVDNMAEFTSLLAQPDYSRIGDPAIYLAGLTIAIVASLETLLNLQAVDKLDTQRRVSPPSRELLAQGAGNIVAGMIVGLPITSVVIRGSVNVGAGSRTKLSAIIHGVMLLVSVVLLPTYLNQIPLSALSAILLVTGLKLASPALFREMWSEGRYQFIPFIVTLVSIVFTNLLLGIVIGLGVSILFVLNSNLRRPLRRIVETHLDGEILVIELTNQVSFLNRAPIQKVLNEIPAGTHLIIDATETDYMDPDVQSLIRDFRDTTAPIHGVDVSLRGFREKYNLKDEMRRADYATRELQDRLTPTQVLNILREGNRRFRTDNRLSRDFNRQINATALEQNPFAMVLSCIDSRVPAEVVFDMGIGDIFSARVAGNVPGETELGSIEYAVAVAGVKLVLVMGHTRCGAVMSTVRLLCTGKTVEEATGCDHLHTIVREIDPCLENQRFHLLDSMNQEQIDELTDEVARRNVVRTVKMISVRSSLIREEVARGHIMVVGALYDVATGEIDYYNNDEEDAEHWHSSDATD